MGVYTNVQNDVFSVFSNVAWTDLNIVTYPANSIPVNPGNEFLRISILPSGNGETKDSISGLVMIDIFIASGNGPKRLYELADILDTHLRNKYLTVNTKASTQFYTSTMRDSGKDPDNPALYRAIYQIPFNYFGVM